MFERTLSSLIKGLRSHRGRDEAKYVAGVMDEIRVEVKSGDMDVKAEAVLKLGYLQMLGYDAAQTSFHVLEVMASPRYHQKQIGYLAAAQSFDQQTDVLILATNLIKKDLISKSPLEVSVALNGLSHIVTADLAQHLAPDITRMLTHSRPAVRKRAVLVLYSVIMRYPAMLEASIDRLRERLEDTDTSVVSATVNVVCELARRKPDAFVVLSPQFFRLLTTSTNNWMLIKLVKLFGALTPHEPRLVRKLLPVMRRMLATTPAMSLLYECMHTIIVGDMLDAPEGEELATTCVERLSAFLDDEDQNLKYMALLALAKVLPGRPWLVSSHREAILASLDDRDLSIRLRALEITRAMADRDSLRDIIDRLLAELEGGVQAAPSAAASLQRHLLGSTTPASPPPASYRLEVIRTILALGSHETYSRVVDFESYVDVLIRLARIANVEDPSSGVGAAIRDQLIDITSRVRAVRPHASRELADLLEDETFVVGSTGDTAEVLHAAAWVLGEYASDAPPGSARFIIPQLVRPSLSDACSASTRAACVQNAIKLFAFWAASLADDWTAARIAEVEGVAVKVREALERLSEDVDGEVQERAVEGAQLFLLISKDLEAHRLATSESSSSTSEPPKAPRSLHLLSPLFFSHTLGPVAKRAQAKVAVPSGLDLEADIIGGGEWELAEPVKNEATGSRTKGKARAVESSKAASLIDDDDPREKARIAEARAKRLQRQKEDPFYISDSRSGKKAPASKKKGAETLFDDVDDIPIVQLSLDEVPGLALANDSGGGRERKTAPPPTLEEEEAPGDEAPTPPTIAKVVRKGAKETRKKRIAVGEDMIG